MNKRLFLLLLHLLMVSVLTAQTSSENYVRVRTYLSSDSSQWRDKILYYDAMGQPTEEVLVGASKKGGDIVSLKEYDSYGRLARDWSPAAVLDNAGRYVDYATLSSLAIESNANDSEPWSQTLYEPSPLDRPLKQYGAGSDWHQRGKGVTTSYLLNVEGDPLLDCKHYTAEQNGLRLFITNHGSWPSGSLDVTCTSDEDGHTVYEFRDMDGQLVLSREPTGNGNSSSTYYVRDVWGNLQAVLPPLASSAMTSPDTEWSSDEDLLLKYAYIYIYDSRYRQIAKRQPGCGWVYTIYDKSDTPVFTQDGNQRQQGQWSYVLTDSWGRPCQVGVCTNTFNIWNNPLPGAVVATRSSAGYTFGGTSLSNAVVMTETYYDHYDNIPIHNLNYDSDTGYDEKYDGNPVGKATATKIRLLDDSGTYLYSKTYYDQRGNVVQTKATNHLGGVDTEYISYDFTDKAIARQHIHTATGQTTRTERYTYEYDFWGRLTQETHQLGNAKAVVINRNTYDDIGRLEAVSHGNLHNARIDYSYNVRSWLTSISSPLFSQTLVYNNPYADNSYYSGQISRMTWRTSSSPYQGVQKSYDYYYDKQGRLIDAKYDKFDNPGGHYDVSFRYDDHGNVINIDRYDKDENGNRDKADEVALYYNGNQLRSLDAFDPYVGSNTHVQYNSNVSGGTEYEYDGNGNMTKDVHHNIQSISYNLLNKPLQLTFADGNITRYTYDATGRKLRVEYGSTAYTMSQPQTSQMNQQSDGFQAAGISVTSTTDYVGNYVYQNGSQWYLTLDCGEVSLSGSTSASSYYFDLKDYQGNVRVAVRSDTSSPFVTDYYPYGGVIRKGKTGTHHRLFIGKELDKMHALNWYDFGARMYDPSLGRFTTMDPLAENDYSTSPYVYCGNDPVNRIDKDGRIWDTVLDLAFVAYDAAEATYQYCATGSVSNTTKAALTADVMAAAVPGLTGTGLAVRMGAKAAETSIKVNTVSKVVKASVHGNSKASTKAQHAYDIINTKTNKVIKTGISGGQIKNGKSVRAETQVKKWNKESGDGTYKSEITHHEPAGEGSRTRILDYEKERANVLREELKAENKHKRP